MPLLNNTTPDSFVISDRELAQSLMEVIPLAMRQIRESNRSHSGSQLSLAQFRVMAHIWRNPKTNKELADDIGLSAAAMSRLVSGLANKKLLKRVINNADRREAHIEITAKGLTLFKGIRNHTGKKVEKRLKNLTPSDKEILLQGMNLVKKIMTELHSPFSPKPNRYATGKGSTRTR